MIAVTVVVTETATTIQDLILTAIPGFTDLPSNGRVCEIQFQWRSGSDIHLVWKPGTTDIGGPTIDLAVDSGRLFNASNALLTLRAPTANQISLLDMYLVVPDGGGGDIRILAYSM